MYDAGEQLSGLLDIEDNYHYQTPLRLSLERKLSLNHGIEVSANYNEFLESKIFNRVRLADDIKFLAVDVAYKYYFSNLFLDPYRSSYEISALVGFGNNFYDSEWGLSLNSGIGISYYLTDTLLISGQGILKFSIVDPLSINNFLHFNVGLTLKLPKT